jgi:uncharacterized protein (TIGR02145 family)
MKKNLILMMLLLTGAVSMNAQDAPANPTMVVTGNVVNAGKITSKIAIDLRKSSEGVSTIDNKATGDIKTPFFHVDANTLLNNDGEIYVGSVSDGSEGSVEIDGITYATANFGAAGTWMTENLRRTTGLTENTEGTAVTTPAYTHVNLDAGYDGSYGLLYNWYGATNGENTSTDNQGNTSGQAQIQGICPTGWHLPTDYEWSQLETVIAADVAGLYSTLDVPDTDTDFYTTTGIRGTNAGQKMRSTTKVNSVTQTSEPKSNAINAGGFNSLLVGRVGIDGIEWYGQVAHFWTSSSGQTSVDAWYRYQNYDWPGAGRSGLGKSKSYFFSVRCKKN